MSRRPTSTLAAFLADEGGVMEGDWALVIGSVCIGLAMSSWLGCQIGTVLGDAFDELIMGALRRAGA